MNYAIWKFPIETTDEQMIEMPAGAEILCVQLQFGGPCLWAMVNLSEVAVKRRRIRVYGTGHPCEGGRYIGTYQLHEGRFVGHVFEV